MDKIIKFLTSWFACTPLHPQWLMFRDNYKSLSKLDEVIRGIVLDIGCGRREVEQYLPNSVDYLGLDYFYTSVNWYHSFPDIYADAVSLPLSDKSIDTVLLLDVLEHLKEPERCMKEISRILNPGGNLILQVPFVYPVHDKPLDFRRWTTFGLHQLAQNNGFTVKNEKCYGQPLETAAMLFNIAFSKMIINCYNNKNPLVVLILFAPVLVPLTNILAWFISFITPKDDMMPGYIRVIMTKK